MSTRIRLRRDTAANWTSNNPTLTTGEMGYETDTGKFKIGNNTNAWTALAYSISAELSEGNLNDLKDVTITSAANGDFLRWNGTAWINDAVNLTTDTVGNYMVGVTAGTGILVTHTPGEGSDATIAIGQDVGTGQSVTFAGATIDAIKIGVTTANTIDTVSGNLTINSVGGTVTVDDNLTVTGNLTVSGTTTSINTETLAVDDNIIVLNNNVTGSPTENAGIEVERGTSANVLIRYNETNDNWEMTNNGSSYSPIETTATVDTSLKQQLWLNTVYAATAAILPGSPSYAAGTSDLNGGTGIGAKITATTNGALTVDGGPAPLGDRILVKNQANALHNGIYEVTTAGSAGAPYELTRATDFNNSTFGQTTYGKSVRVATGTVNALQVFAVTSLGSVALGELDAMIHVIGTDSFTWTQVSGKATLIPGNGLQIVNNDLSLPTITQSNTTSTNGSGNFVQSVTLDSYGRVTGITTNDAMVELGAKTSGNYVSGVTATGGTGITVSGSGTEGAAVEVGSNATSTNTVSTIVSRDGSGNFSAGAITASLTGNASTADKLNVPRAIELSGDVTGTANFDGSAAINITATIAANSVALGTDTTGEFVASLVAGVGITLANNSGEAASPTVTVDTTVIQAKVANVTDTEISYLDGVTSPIQTQMDTKAPLASPTFTGTVTIPSGASISGFAPLASPTFTGTPTLPTGTIATTQTAANNTTAVATTAYVDAAVSAGVATVDTLDDLSDVTAPTPTSGDLLKWNGTAWVNAAGYALLASPTFTGTPTLPTGTIATTQTAANSTTAVATTAFVTTADALKANLASPTFTGTVTIPSGASISGFALLASPTFTGTPTLPTGTIATTQTALDSSTKVATTAFVTTADALKANLASPTFTGTVTIPSGASISGFAPLASPTFTGTVTVPTPTNGTDAVNKSYADAITQSLDIKDSVRVASTVNITIASALTNTSTIDGVVVATGDRVLLKNQTTASQNGIYVVVASGAASRSTDANTSAKVTTGMYVFVSEGTVSADMGYVLTTNDAITLDTTSLTFTQFSGAGQITAGTGITKSANTLSVDTTVIATLASPTFTGTPTLPTGTIATTQTALDSSTKLATTAFVTTADNLKANLASPTFTGTPTLPTGTIATTQTGSNNTTAVATTAYVDAADALVTSLLNAQKANLASPTFTGTVTIPSGASISGFAPLASPTFTGTVTLPSGTVTSTMILDGTIANADISTTAAIDLGKLADVSTSAQTASYTLVLADKDKIVEMGVATANTLTVSPNSSVAYPVGAQINILQTGAGQTTVTAGAGVTINGTPGLKLRAQWSYATLIKRATDTWVLVGDIAA